VSDLHPDRPFEPERLAKRVVAAVRHATRVDEGTAVSLHEPEFRGREQQYVRECIEAGWVSSVGEFVNRFERMLAEYTGASYAVATCNGTAALHVSLLLAGVKSGDEVLIPTLTFIATANAVTYARATPHLVDCEVRTLGVDAAKLHEYLREIAEIRGEHAINRQTRAVIRALMPMHTFGLPADLDALRDLCERWKLVLVEDAAESLGSFYKGRHTGTFGKLGALSFNGNKIVTTGGGGAILTNDPEVARRAKHLTTTARVAHQWSFMHDQIGFNYRLPNLNAALGCAQLEQLGGFLARKRALQARYLHALKSVPELTVMSEPAGCVSNYWLIALLLNSPDERLRDSILQELNSAGLMARPVWTPMHKLSMYAESPRMDLSSADSLAARIINVPSSPWLADGDD
jgi:perosamine synthetase